MEFVRITRDLSLHEVHLRRVEPIDVYDRLVNAWYLQPAEHLASLHPQETDHGMALLALLLLFFEPHGQFLTGELSQGKSKKTFCAAFDALRAHLLECGKIDSGTRDLKSESFYKWARCGLFHSGRLSNELLVDPLGTTSICLAKNPIWDGWLVNPWRLLEQLKIYHMKYVETLKNTPSDAPLRANFLKTYERLVQGSAKHFNELQTAWQQGGMRFLPSQT